MNIIGIGTIFAGGRGIDKYEDALSKGSKYPTYLIPQEAIKDKEITRKMRRADRFSRISYLAAFDAVEESKVSVDSLGVIIATGFGPHNTTFKFLDGVLDYGEKGASPTEFSHSVHNAAASYVSTLLKSKGPTLTVTDFSFPFQNALLVAQSWLNQGRCNNVLVGAVDEQGEVMDYIYKNKLSIGEVNPFNFSSSKAMPGEGGAFLVLTNSENKDKYCRIEDICFGAKKQSDIDICIIDADGMISNVNKYRSVLDNRMLVGAYSTVFGSMITGSAFNCVAGALMIKNRTCYGCNQPSNYNLNIPKKTKPAQFKKIQCVKCGCHRRIVSFNLKGG